MSIEPEPLAAEVLPEEGEDEYQLIVRVLKRATAWSPDRRARPSAWG